MIPDTLHATVTGLVYAVAPMAAGCWGLRSGCPITAAAAALTAMGVGMGLVIVGSLVSAKRVSRRARAAESRARCAERLTQAANADRAKFETLWRQALDRETRLRKSLSPEPA